MARSRKENPSPSEIDGTSRRHNRRQALGLAGVAAAAAAVAAVGMNGGKKAQAVTGDNMKVGQLNEATPGDGTELAADVDGASALNVTNPAAPGGTAIHGDGPNGATGLRGTSTSGPGVHATSEDEPAVLGVSGSPRLLAEGDPGFSLGAGPGVEGHSGSGPGVHGISDSGPGVHGESQGAQGIRGVTYGPPDDEVQFIGGVVGMALKPGVEEWPPTFDDLGDGIGVLGASGAATAVQGHSNDGVGVFGGCVSGPGVVGQSLGAPGLHGTAPGDHPGVRAASDGVKGGALIPDGGLALDVAGKARFSTAGDGVVPAKAYTATVANPAVTADSHITVTLTDDPGRASVVWVERQADTGFTVHMSSRPRSAVPFSYLIVEPGV